MGLPIWRNYKEEAQAAATEAAKPADPTANARSTIRRRPSVHGRGPRAHTLRQTLENNSANWRELPTPTSNIRASSVSLAIPRPPPPPVPESRNYFERPNISARPRSRRERSTNTRQTEVHEGWEPPQIPSQEHITAMSGIARRARRSTAEETDPTPVDVSRYGATQSRLARSESLRHVIPRLHRTDSQSDTITIHPSSQNERTRPNLPTPPLENSDLSEQPSSRRLPTPPSGWDSWVPGSPSNGLGDRMRSPSPLSQADDAWEVMRSTIQPDETLPSLESSFASQAASASFANANLTGLDTLSTAPVHLRGETDESSLASAAELDCISYSDSEPEMSDTERTIRPEDLSEDLANDPVLREQFMDEEELRARLQMQRRQAERERHNRDTSSRARQPRDQNDAVEMLVRRSQRQNAGRAFSSLTFPEDGPLPDSQQPSQSQATVRPTSGHPRSQIAQTRESMRSSADLLRDMSANLARDESDLEQMRGILQRLAESQDIPDDLWMSAGLTRTHMRERTRTIEERIQSHERERERRTAVRSARAPMGRL